MSAKYWTGGLQNTGIENEESRRLNRGGKQNI
jgi:hypothetical protein